ncbi:YvcK family protein [Candidatus Kaiserbacteria bacterium]|nr:YvcK family protein [Candidatus Kaiserbacteria bacterium]MCB9812584.1 YvcK family protein [Candidatus Nomurabacteria bacterium]
MKKQSVVVIGGGTGTHTVLRGLKLYQKQLTVSAVVTMADSGGSTGRLRDEFGYLPVGDVRMALAALASDIDEHEELVRQLFLYRFDKGNGLSGHNFGNLLLVALTDILGSEEAAIRAAARLLSVQGTVIPVTTNKVDLVATYDDGVELVGEHSIDEPTADRALHHITSLSVTPAATITEGAEAAILNADLVVLGPGDLYTSVLANCVVAGVADAIRHAPGKVVYIANLMTKLGQTSRMGVAEHVAEIERYTRRTPDAVLVNTSPLPADLVARYAKDSEFPVAFNCESAACRVIPADLLAEAVVQKSSGDVLKRSLIRHDSRKLARKLVDLL